MSHVSPGEGPSAVAAGEPSHPLLQLDYWTDPLCCWSWAMEPHLQRLRAELGGRLIVHLRLGGMIPDWSRYSDPLNSVSRPAHMGPIWFHAAREIGCPIDHRIWLEDPPESSYPSCIAVKAAGLQSPLAAERYLFRLRRAVMQERRNIARREVLLEVAEELAADEPSTLDHARLERDLASPPAVDAFREDLTLAAYRSIGRFPTLILRAGAGPGLLLVGYRPYEVLIQVIGYLDNDWSNPKLTSATRAT